MRRSGVRCLVLAFILAAVAGCRREPGETIDFGRLDNGLYHNRYLGLTIELPTDWHVQDHVGTGRFMAAGAEVFAGEDQGLRAFMDASRLTTVPLFSVFRRPIGAPVEINPNLIAMAERIDQFPGVESGRDYLFHAKRVIGAGAVQTEIDPEIEPVTIGDVGFDMMRVRIPAIGVEVEQEYYVALVRRYALVFILSHGGGEDREELKRWLHTARFQ